MNAETLASFAGVILSLLFAYVPRVKEWYTAREATEKAGLMAVLIVLVAVATFAASCGEILAMGVTCDKQGAVGLLQLVITALVANQSSYVLLVRPYQGGTEKV